MDTQPTRSVSRGSRRGGINVHLYASTLLHETRMGKMCRAITRLRLFSRVEMIGIQEEGLPGTETNEGVVLRRLPRRHWGGPKGCRKLVQTLDWSRRVVNALRLEDVECVNCHSLMVLPLGVSIKSRHRARLIYDTHELETERNGVRGFRQALDRWAERRLIRECDGVVVVSDSIANWYARTYGIPRPAVVRNVPEVLGEPAAPDPGLWRERFGIPAEHLVFIYQGGLFSGRRIEQLLRVFSQTTPERHVVFMGYGELEKEVRAAAARHGNIHYTPAVPPAEVLRHTAGADVGLVGVENACLSYYFSLPNKLFEFLMAGIPALMPGYPEMARIAESTGCGWTVGESDADWLAAVNSLGRSAVDEGKARARTAAGSVSWLEEEKKYLELVKRATSMGSPA